MLNTPLDKKILHTTDNYIKSLKKWWINTVWDMIFLFPKFIEDRSNILNDLTYINLKEKNTILVKIISIDNSKTSSWKVLTKIIIEDEKKIMAEIVFFNRQYLSKNLERYINKQVIMIWTPKYEFWKLTFLSPEIETNINEDLIKILPVYSDINYIPWNWIANKMRNLKKYFDYIQETLPEEIIKKYNFISKKEAIFKLHFPTSKKDFEIAKNRLTYDELYEINYKSLYKKHEKQKETIWKAIKIELNPDLVKDIISKIDFELTNHQKIALFQILKDMWKTHSMQRMLQWDVWTWKTIVAAISAIHTIKESEKIWHKIQVCIMAPTEILARQHFEWLEKLFNSYNLKSNLLVWSTTKKQKEIIKENLKNWEIDIIIWTHALIEEDVFFNNLWYVIIDEQHRFWVRQREVLELWLGNKNQIIPHCLNMTATPIPRSLALTMYWDQDLSIINEYPKNRKTIFTKVIKNDLERKNVELFIKTELEKWRQVFWINPLVEESEKIDLANAIDTFNSLTEIFFPYKVWLLHGKMKAKEKQEIMDLFSKNEIQILSSTSVVEVWVNIPNASIMCIEWAERFWLSQLHQFRWRVWRWVYQSYCYLFPSNWNKTDRLQAMEKTNNWFELAQIDLELRWPWEVYWVRQSWAIEFKIADVNDLEIVSQIREDIEEMVLKNK